ncbi:type II secretion system F family protein [bacterium]|nr:type II secretion system F family protein [bacterium]
MFEWMIPLIIAIAVFLLASEIQKVWRASRLRRQAMVIVGSRTRPAFPRQTAGYLEKKIFKLIPQMAAWQVAWVSPSWALRVEKQLVLLPKWQGRKAGEWLAAKELCLAAGLLIGLALGAGLVISFGMGVLAFILPDLWRKERVRAVRRGIMRELPDALDLLAAGVEAGLGLEQAINVLLERGRQGFIFHEFSEMMRTIRMGRSRRDALRFLSRRVDDPDFSTFITALVQAERLGVSIGATLKTQAVQLRTKRFQQVEKLALEAPVKLLFPLIVFIFPVVFIILFGPIVIRFMQGF